MVQRNFKSLREQGFSLIEVLIAVLIVGILAAIVIPIVANQQREATAAQYKNDLITAAFLIDQEAVDNNGLYPTYLPNEVKNNSRMSGFVYSYSEGRTAYCIQANSPVGKFFVSSANATKVVETSCTEAIIADGNNTPWKKPTLTLPPTPTVNVTWAANSAAATATFNIPAQTCTLDAADQAEWGPKTKVQYRYLVYSLNEGGVSETTAWSTSPTANYTFAGAYPSQRFLVTAQYKCIISTDIDYAYNSKESDPGKAVQLPNFPMSAPVFATSAASWESGSGVRVQATWNDLICPTGTKKVDYDIQTATNGSYVYGSSAFDPEEWVSGKNLVLPSFPSDGKAKISLTLSCLQPDGKFVTSATTTKDLTAVLLAPNAPTSLAGQWLQPSTVSPSRLTWTGVTCSQGGPQYNATQKTPASGWTSGWVTTTTASPALVAGTTYTFEVTARCASGTNYSASSPASAPVTFTATVRPPDAPANPANFRSTWVSPSDITPSRLNWDAVTCAWGTPQYLLTRSNPSGWNSGWITTTQADPPLQASVTYTFTIAARCMSGTTAGTASPGAPLTFTVTPVVPNAPATPTGFANNANGSSLYKNDQLTWSAVTCVDSTPQYIVRQMTKDNTVIAEASRPTSGWLTGTSYNVPVTPGSTVKFEVAAKCVSPAGVDSNITAYGTSSGAEWTTTVTPPTAVRSASLAQNGTATWSAPSTTCPSGSTLQYNVTNGSWNGGWTTSTSQDISKSTNWSIYGGDTNSIIIRARCAGPNASSVNSADATASVTITRISAPTTYHSDGSCSNFRSGPGTGYGVYSCQGGGSWLYVYNYCNAGGFTWVKTDWGWTTSINLSNVSTTTVRYSCTP